MPTVTSRTVALAGAAAAALLLCSCGGARSAEDTAREVVARIDEGSISEDLDLFDQAPSQAQLERLKQVGADCTFDLDEVVTSASEVTVDSVGLLVPAECDGQTQLLGATLLRQDGEGDFRVSPPFLPGGSHAGDFATHGLPADLRDLPPLR